MHTKEPWQQAGSDGIKDSTGKFWIASLHSNVGELSPAITKANASRIVAAVNACAGISTEDLENSKGAEMLLRGISQRDELLAALKQMVSSLKDKTGETMPDVAFASALISKCETK